MSWGAYITASSYLLLAVAAYWSAGGRAAHWLWLTSYFFVYTIGELFILPVGLGLFGRLAPRGYAATMIAAWFLASFAGNFAAGALGALWGPLSPALFFVATAIVCALSGVLLSAVLRRQLPPCMRRPRGADRGRRRALSKRPGVQEINTTVALSEIRSSAALTLFATRRSGGTHQIRSRQSTGELPDAFWHRGHLGDHLRHTAPLPATSNVVESRFLAEPGLSELHLMMRRASHAYEAVIKATEREYASLMANSSTQSRRAFGGRKI